MPQSVDGDIRLSVGIDTAPVKKKFSDLGRDIVSVFKSFSSPKGLEETDAKIIELTKEADSAVSRIRELQREISRISPINLDTADFDKLVAETEQVEKRLEDLQTQRINTLATTNKNNPVTVKQLQEIDTEIAKLEDYMDSLVDKIDAFQAEQERQEENNRRLETLNAQLSQAQSEYDTLRSVIQETSEAQREQTRSTDFVGKFRNVASIVKSALSKSGKFLKSFASVAKTSFNKVAGFAKSAFNTVAKHARDGGKTSTAALNNINGAFRKGFRNILRYGLGIRGTFALFRKLRTAVKEGMGNLAQYSDEVNQDISGVMSSFTRLKNSLATMFQPLLKIVAPILTSIINKASQVTTSIGKVIAAFAGQDYVYEAVDVQEDYAKSLDKTSKSAKKAKKALDSYLSPLDDLNRYEAPDTTAEDEDALDPSKMFKLSTVESNFKNLANKIKDILKSNDWTSLGTFVGEKLNNILSGINWETIQSKARLFATRLFTLINGFISSVDWSLLGRSITEGIKSALIALSTFLEGLNFSAIGDALATMFNEIASPANAALLASTLSRLFSGALTLLATLIGGLDWKKISATIISLISNFKIADLAAAANNLLTSFAGALRKINFSGIGKAFSTGLSKINWEGIWNRLAEIFSSLLKSITDLFGLKGVNTNKLQKIIRDIKNPISEIFSTVKELARTIIPPIINKLLPSIINAISRILSGISPIISALTPFIDKTISVITDVINAVAPIFETLGNTIGKIIQSLQPIFTPLAELIGKVAEILAPAIDFILGAIGLIFEALTPINEAVGGLISLLIGDGSPTISSTIQAELDNLASVSDNLDIIHQNIDSAISGVDESLSRTAGDLQYIDDLRARMEELLKKSTLTDSDMLELKTIADLISEKVPEFKTAWEEMTTTDDNGKLTFNLNKDEMVKSIGSVIDKLKEQYATEALEEQYKQLYSDKIKANQDIALATQDVIDAQEGLKKAQDEYNEAVKRQIDAGETFGPLADAVRDAEAGLDQYNENLQTAEAKLLAAKGKQEEFNTKLDSLGNTLDVVAGKYDENNKNLQALRDAYDNGFIDVETLKRNFKVSEAELFKGTKSMAEQSALGYQKGINEQAKTLMDAGMEVPTNVLIAAREGFDIHSPSGEFEKIASYDVDGLVLGFKKNMYKAVTSAKELACQIVAGFKAGILGFNNSLDFLPSMFRSKFNEILSIFSAFLSNLTAGLNDSFAQINQLNEAFASSKNAKNYTVWNPLPSINIPHLARGAVIPPNREFLAVLGDQNRGNNIEAPESLIRQIIRDELATSRPSSGNVYEIPLVVGRKTITKLIIDEAKLMLAQTGNNPFDLVPVE